jgi:hypothetical protein
MFRKNTMVLMNIYEQLIYTVSWLQIQSRQRLITELESIRVVKSGSKVMPLLYDKYDIPREWSQSDNYPICDMV